MSLSKEEKEATKEELGLAMQGVNWSSQDLALALSTSIEKVDEALDLASSFMENPWVIKEILADQARLQGKEPVLFSALKGDYRDYWFLDSSIIDERILR